MRLMLIGTLQGYITEAGKLAMAKGAKVAHAEDIDMALEALRAGKGADLVMIDVKQDIAAFIKQIKAERIVVPVVAFGLGNSKEEAVRAIRAGAQEYLPLPPNAELIAAVLAAASEESETVIAVDQAMKTCLAMADQVAPSEATIMITGESGTGKEVMAKYLHRMSKRANGPFIAVNCAAIPEALLESELFGHEKGAFTGAVARRIGKFEEATGGTLFLDEIGEMDVRLQSKLLRVLQEREIDRVGGSSPVKVNIRVVTATNRNLEDEVKAGNFREDLYFRLNVIAIELPALRDRPADIAPLAEFFVKKYSEANGVAERELSQAAREKLAGHYWRGNVRELENTMHRAVLLAIGNQIGADAIRLSGQAPAAVPPVQVMHAELPVPEAHPMVGRTVASVEQDLILGTLNHCLGNRTHAANILGISIRTLRNKLREYADSGVRVPAPGTENAERALAG
jgi:two-component system response regulator FlrC